MIKTVDEFKATSSAFDASSIKDICSANQAASVVKMVNSNMIEQGLIAKNNELSKVSTNKRVEIDPTMHVRSAEHIEPETLSKPADSLLQKGLKPY